MKKKLFICLYFFISLKSLAEAPVHLLFVGDSLTEGYGVPREKAYPALIEKKMRTQAVNFPIKVTNGGVTGSTTANAQARLSWFLKSQPDVLFLALGANDGLRGIKVESSYKNLAATIELAQKNNVRVILAGMMMPPNYGASYRKKFKTMYIKLKHRYKLDFIPFLLEGVAGEKKYNLADGIHPNVEGHEIIARAILRPIVSVLKNVQKKK